MPLFSTRKGLWKAAAKGDVAAVRYYVSKHPDWLNAKDKKGMTALNHAASEGHAEVVRELITRGADMEIRSRDSSTALDNATETKKTAASLLLIDAGADVNSHGPAYIYPLHRAAYAGDRDVITSLIAHGAEINAVITNNGRTALHWAVARGFANIAEALLEAGARTDLPDSVGKTALNLAHEKGDNFVRLLEKFKPAAPTAETSERWARTGANRVTHIGIYPDINRKLTEIFNFESRERTTITENLKTGAETIGAAEKFDTLAEDGIKKALSEFRRLGGEADENFVLSGNTLRKALKL